VLGELALEHLEKRELGGVDLARELMSSWASSSCVPAVSSEDPRASQQRHHEGLHMRLHSLERWRGCGRRCIAAVALGWGIWNSPTSPPCFIQHCSRQEGLSIFEESVGFPWTVR